MLFKALNFIKDEVNSYMGRQNMSAFPLVLGNIARQDDPNGANSSDGIGDKLVLTLINIEEEGTLKNESIYKSSVSSATRQFPPTFLNLYLLFSANIDDYEEALTYLSLVLEFFQQKKRFQAAEFPGLQGTGIDTLIFESFDTSFEQTYNLWGVLGSKLVPNVLYKVRSVSIQRAPETGTGIIEEIVVNDQTISS